MKFKIPPFKIEEVAQSLSEVRGWGLDKAGVPDTWSVTRGEGITVFVIDTGFPSHQDLSGNILGYVNFVKGEPVDDLNGHETAVCGVIAARANDDGMIGVAPEAKIFAIKGLNKDGVGDLFNIFEALKFVCEVVKGTDPKIRVKPDIICMSLGTADPLPDFIYDKIKELYNAGVVIICAAGNSGKRGVDYPAAYPECIAIGAHDENGNAAPFSAVGKGVDFSAPGVDVYTTWLNGGYKKVRGTSFAAPFVAGIVALMLSKHKKQEAATGKNDCKTPKQVKEHLAKYSVDAGAAGKDDRFGYGIIDFSKDEQQSVVPPLLEKTTPKKSPWWKRLLGL